MNLTNITGVTDMRFIDKYPDCVGCPVIKYCGTMVGSIRLCNSYDLNNTSNDSNS